MMDRHDKIRAEIPKHIPDGWYMRRWWGNGDTVTVEIAPKGRTTITFTMPENGESTTAGCPGHPHDNEQF